MKRNHFTQDNSSFYHPKKIRMMIADDIQQVRDDLHVLFSLVESVEIVGEARDGCEAVHLAEVLKPNVILMDLEMPGLNGIEATRLIKKKDPSVKIIILSIHKSDDLRFQSNSAGANLFLQKGEALDTLIEAVLT